MARQIDDLLRVGCGSAPSGYARVAERRQDTRRRTGLAPPLFGRSEELGDRVRDEVGCLPREEVAAILDNAQPDSRGLRQQCSHFVTLSGCRAGPAALVKAAGRNSGSPLRTKRVARCPLLVRTPSADDRQCQTKGQRYGSQQARERNVARGLRQFPRRRLGLLGWCCRSRGWRCRSGRCRRGRC